MIKLSSSLTKERNSSNVQSEEKFKYLSLVNDSMSLHDFLELSTDKWCIKKEDQGLVHIKQKSDEIIVSEKSVRSAGIVRIINRNTKDSIPEHKVRVAKVNKLKDSSSLFSYEAKVIDDDIQQNTQKSQQDVNKRRTTADPLSSRRSKTMSNITRL